MDILREYKIKQANERKQELQKILISLQNDDIMNALYAIYNNERDQEAMKPVLKKYFEEELEEAKRQLKAYSKL
ncbi:MAG: hypothetical protein ACLSVX_12405 [Massilimicrobiota timonensis]